MKKEKKAIDKKVKKVVEKKPKKPKKVTKSKVTLVEFTMSAVIPTVQYGNIQPSITVKADSIESAQDVVRPFIEQMYDKYSEQVPRFLKPAITVKEKVVPAETIVEKSKVEPTPVVPVVPAPVAPVPVEKAPEPAAHPVNATDVPFGDSVAQDAYLKAENVIKSCSSAEALAIIETKIKESTKIAEKDKPALQEMIQGRYRLITF